MKKPLILMMLLTIVSLWSCHGDDAWDQIPQPVVKFIEAYWPGSNAQSMSTDKDGSINVRLYDGPGMQFTSSYAWVYVDGYGQSLPEQFLFDCMPEKLYDYLQATESTGQIFKVSRNARTYELTLLNQNLTYTIADGSIKATPTTLTSPN